MLTDEQKKAVTHEIIAAMRRVYDTYDKRVVADETGFNVGYLRTTMLQSDLSGIPLHRLIVLTEKYPQIFQPAIRRIFHLDEGAQ